MQITPAGTNPSKKGETPYFTGAVRIDAVTSAPEPARIRAALVTFEPGARTAWHSHPLGQTLVVTAGVGRAQTEGGPVRALHPGDVAWFPPGEKHWHGASPEHGMTHLAMQEALDGKTADWMEEVDETDYSAAPAP